MIRLRYEKHCISQRLLAGEVLQRDKHERSLTHGSALEETSVKSIAPHSKAVVINRVMLNEQERRIFCFDY